MGGRNEHMPFFHPGTHPPQRAPSFPGCFLTPQEWEKGESAVQALSLPPPSPRE